MSRKKIIDFPDLGNVSTKDYYELLLSGKRATRTSTKGVQSVTPNIIQKTLGAKPSKKKYSKKDNSSPYKKKKADELVPPSPPEEKIKIRFLFGCVWGQDVIGRKAYLINDEIITPGIIKAVEPVVKEELMPVKYLVDEHWVDLRRSNVYITGEIVEYQGIEYEVLWEFPFPISYPKVLLKSPESRLVK
jgi:hypothetical protein